MSYKLKLVAGCSAAALFAGQAMAADPSAAGSPEEDIIVTAQKKTEFLKDVPAAVTAVTGTDLQAIDASGLEDYVSRVPGLTVSNVSMAAASTQLTIRGITTGPGGNPTVGVYIDDSPFGSSSSYGGYTVPDLDPQDLARVEVLRGPQGTLYGAGSMGGLIKYVTAAPDPSHFSGRIGIEGSTIDGGGQGYAVRGSANVPLSDTMAVRISGYDREDPGYVDNILTGQKDIDKTRYYGGRASFGWKISDDWKVRLSAIYQYQHGAGPVVDYDPTTFKPIYGDLKQSDAKGADDGKQKIGAYSLLVEGNIGDFATLTSATAYDRQRLDLHVDLTTAFGPILDGAFGVPNAGVDDENLVRVDKITQELRIASAGDHKLSWQFGGFYTHEKTKADGAYNPIDPLTGAPVGGLPPLGFTSINEKFEEKAVFGDITYKFTSSFDITGGLRYSANNQRTLTTTNGVFVGGTTQFDIPSKDHSLTFLVNPRLRLNKDTMIYARFATGYRPGGPNLPSTGSPISYGPDKVTNYEVGLKSDLLDHKVSLELSAYWIDWKDIQVQEVNPVTAVSYIGNGSAATSKGVEASLSWRPIRRLEFFGNAAYQHADVTRDFPTGGAIAHDGDRLPLTPRWSGTLGADYSIPVFADWSAQFGGDWHHVGQTLGAFPNPGVARFVHPAYDVINLRAGFTNDRWTVMFYAKNIGDDRGQTADLNVGTTRVSVIQPRTFALSLSTKF